MRIIDRALAGLKWSSITVLVLTLIQFLQVLILSRYLSADDFGIISLILIVAALSQTISDLGLSSSIIAFQNLTNAQLSALFWINVFCGFISLILLFAAAPAIASFFRSPEMIGPLQALSVRFAIFPVGGIFKSLRQKEMDFGFIGRVEISAASAGLIVAAVSAELDLGVYSLVYGVIVQSIIYSTAFFCYGFVDHVSVFRKISFRGLSEILMFGFYKTWDRILNQLTTNLDKIIIGRLLGMEAAGFYHLAWQLVLMPISKINPILNNVAFPLYAQLKKDLNALSGYYAMTVRVVCVSTVPLMIFAGVFSNNLVEVLYGSGWSVTSDLITVLVFVGILRAVANPGGALLLALGNAKAGFWWNIFWSCILNVGLFVGLSASPIIDTVPCVLVGLMLTIGWGWHYIVARYSGVKEYPKILLHLLTVTVTCYLLAFTASIVANLIGAESQYLRLAAGGAVFLLLFFMYLWRYEFNKVAGFVNSEKVKI
jgi:O-antigen/teichoic acid export membrane protein